MLCISSVLAVGAEAQRPPQQLPQFQPQLKKITVVGTISTINAEEKSFTLEKPGFFASIFTIIRGEQRPTIRFKVLTSQETEIKKKSLAGVEPAQFTDLKTGQKVQAKGVIAPPLNARIIRANSVFILTPPKPLATKECESNTDCIWCGVNCINAKVKENRNIACPQISPPQGFECKCVEGKCQKVLTGETTTTTSTTITASDTTTTTTSTTTPSITNKTCQEVCKGKEYQNGICRTWPITPRAKIGCKKDEINAGQTKDCTTLVGGRRLIGVGRTCCCSNVAVQE